MRSFGHNDLAKESQRLKACLRKGFATFCYNWLQKTSQTYAPLGDILLGGLNKEVRLESIVKYKMASYPLQKVNGHLFWII